MLRSPRVALVAAWLALACDGGRAALVPRAEQAGGSGPPAGAGGPGAGGDGGALEGGSGGTSAPGGASGGGGAEAGGAGGLGDGLEPGADLARCVAPDVADPDAWLLPIQRGAPAPVIDVRDGEILVSGWTQDTYSDYVAICEDGRVRPRGGAAAYVARFSQRRLRWIAVARSARYVGLQGVLDDDGAVLASASYKGDAVLWPGAGDGLRLTRGRPDAIAAMRLDADGRLLWRRTVVPDPANDLGASLYGRLFPGVLGLLSRWRSAVLVDAEAADGIRVPDGGESFLARWDEAGDVRYARHVVGDGRFAAARVNAGGVTAVGTVGRGLVVGPGETNETRLEGPEDPYHLDLFLAHLDDGGSLVDVRTIVEDSFDAMPVVGPDGSVGISGQLLRGDLVSFGPGGTASLASTCEVGETCRYLARISPRDEAVWARALAAGVFGYAPILDASGTLRMLVQTQRAGELFAGDAAPTLDPEDGLGLFEIVFEPDGRLRSARRVAVLRREPLSDAWYPAGQPVLDGGAWYVTLHVAPRGSVQLEGQPAQEVEPDVWYVAKFPAR